MKLPSLIFILSEIKHALLRFPVALLSISVSGICAVLLIKNNDPGHLIHLMMVSQLGLPLLLALTLLGEQFGWSLLNPPDNALNQIRSGVRSWALLQLGGVLLLVLYYFSLPDNVEGSPLIRFLQLNIGIHLLISFVPFFRYGQNNSIWQFNRILLQRLLAGAIFSLTLFLGLSVALFALDQLFGLTIDGETYPRLLMLVIFIFNSWYFLGGVPRNLTSLEEMVEYPKILKIFSQYILATLVAIYLSILLAYLIKVLITTEWPSGWIGYLVSSVAAAGLCSLVMLYPLAERRENRWIATYARLFYILLLPMVGMLLMAIYQRVDQYGITENRYYLVVLALWLIVTSVKGLINVRPNLKFLPLSLCVLAFLTTCGPWGAFSVSMNSQTQRLSKLLTANAMLVDNQLVRPTGAVSDYDTEQISAVLDYLTQQHSLDSISEWFDEELSVLISAPRDSLVYESRRRGNSSSAVMDYLGLEYTVSANRHGVRNFHCRRDNKNYLFETAGYDFVLPISITGKEDPGVALGGQLYRVVRSLPEAGLTVFAGDMEALRLPLEAMLSSLEAHSTHRSPENRTPGELLTIEVSSAQLRVKLVILEIRWRTEVDDMLEINKLDGLLMIAAGGDVQ